MSTRKYHTTPKGRVMECKARLRDCKYGGENHYPTKEAARAGFEAQQEAQGPTLEGLKKKNPSQEDLQRALKAAQEGSDATKGAASTKPSLSYEERQAQEYAKFVEQQQNARFDAQEEVLGRFERLTNSRGSFTSIKSVEDLQPEDARDATWRFELAGGGEVLFYGDPTGDGSGDEAYLEYDNGEYFEDMPIDAVRNPAYAKRWMEEAHRRGVAWNPKAADALTFQDKTFLQEEEKATQRKEDFYRFKKHYEQRRAQEIEPERAKSLARREASEEALRVKEANLMRSYNSFAEFFQRRESPGGASRAKALLQEGMEADHPAEVRGKLQTAVKSLGKSDPEGTKYLKRELAKHDELFKAYEAHNRS